MRKFAKYPRIKLLFDCFRGISSQKLSSIVKTKTQQIYFSLKTVKRPPVKNNETKIKISSLTTFVIKYFKILSSKYNAQATLL